MISCTYKHSWYTWCYTPVAFAIGDTIHYNL